MPDYYYELTIRPEKDLDLFINLLSSLTNEALEEADGTVIARSEEELENVEYGILEFAKALGVECETKLEKKENIDWIKKYQESVKSIEIGNFFIRPSWDKKREDKIDIIVDPALSFGSGHHETTSSCIEAIDEFVKAEHSVLDVGTGSGILALTCAKLGCKVDVCDTDEVCINDTKSNFELNGVKFNHSWIGSANGAEKKYDVVIANIVADVLVFISQDLKKSLNPNGTLIISGILDKHIDKVLKKFKDLEQIKLIHKNEWMTVVFKSKES